MKRVISRLTIVAMLGGCATQIPPEALQFQADTLANRQLQSRKYDIKTEKELLSASSAVLQDMGFNLDESNVPLGVIVASKSRGCYRWRSSCRRYPVRSSIWCRSGYL